MRTYVSQSNLRPKEWQLEKSTVYHNTNIVECEKEADKGTEKYFEYNVTEYTYEEYNIYLNKVNSDAIDEIVISMLGE